MRKKTAAIFLILAILMVLFFTFQSAEGTTSLSEVVRIWLGEHGVKAESHALRSNIHILEYFILGLAVLAFGKNQGWTIRRCLLVAFLIGIVDEGVKIWIPSREFDVVDLAKDWVGAGLAVAIENLMTLIKLRKKDDIGG